MPPPRVILLDGIRDKTYLIFGVDGFSYYYNKTMKGGRLSLECNQYRKSCRGRASVNDEGYEFRQTQRHNHAPDWNVVHVRRLRSAVLARCRRGDTDPLRTIYDEERTLLRIPRPAAANIPFHSLRPAMERARDESLPPLPHSLTELDVILRDPKYQFLTTTLDGQDSIYSGAAGSTSNGTRCLIFISRRMLLYLKAKVKDMFCDATFCIVPRNLGCSQVWNIVTLRRHHVIAIGSILMQSKSVPCYRVALDAIKRLVPGYRPSRIMCDYEASQQKALSIEFPTVDRSGCLFHASKAMLLQAKEIGLVPLIRENVKCESIVRSLCALPLLSHDRIVAGVAQVGMYACRHGLWDVLMPFFAYIKRTWLTPSRLPILSVSTCEDRTSNCCESYNHTMQTALGQLAHPNIYYLISGFVRLEDRYIQDLWTLKSGGSIGRNRKLSALVNDSRIKGLTEDLNEGNISECTFLRRASRRMQNVFNDILQLVEKDQLSSSSV